MQKGNIDDSSEFIDIIGLDDEISEGGQHQVWKDCDVVREETCETSRKSDEGFDRKSSD